MNIATSPILRRRGRPRSGSSRAERLEHIRCAYLLKRRMAGARALAVDRRVSVETIYRWVRLAFTYADPEAEDLRRTFGVESDYTADEAACR